MELASTTEAIGLSALKYGDLSNQASKDYIFDIDRFTSFEGNTGPYILYTIVRIKSILNKFFEGEKVVHNNILPAETQGEKELMLVLAKFNEVVENAVVELAPHKICAYVYELSNAFNKFYHDTKILSCEDENKKSGYINLIAVSKAILETSINMLGFDAPERM